jgi:hypothetical protein
MMSRIMGISAEERSMIGIRTGSRLLVGEKGRRKRRLSMLLYHFCHPLPHLIISEKADQRSHDEVLKVIAGSSDMRSAIQ